MKGLVQAITTNDLAACSAEDCEDAGCCASIENVPVPHLLVNLNCRSLMLPKGRRADFILATDRYGVASIEMKTGTLSKAVSQLQAGASYLESLLPEGYDEVRFRPVLVHALEFSSVRVRHFATERVRFQGREHPIERIPCGGDLVDALK